MDSQGPKSPQVHRSRWSQRTEEHTGRLGFSLSLSSAMTHPFSIQQQVDFEEHAVVDSDFLVSVEDLKNPAEDDAIVNPRRAEAAFL